MKIRISQFFRSRCEENERGSLGALASRRRDASAPGNQSLVTSAATKYKAAFTMVEIALSLGIIAFALVAIIGVLPMGMNTQRENREDTLVNQDGPYLLEALRNGAQGLDHLTNFVETITITQGTNSVVFTNAPLGAPGYDGRMTNGSWIIGLLGTPKYRTVAPGIIITNKVVARIHSLNEAAVMQGSSTKDLGFGYQVTSEILPFSLFSKDSTNYFPQPTNSPEYATLRTRWLEAQNMGASLSDQSFTNNNANLYEVRLSFRWPLLGNGGVGPKRAQFRALVSAKQDHRDPLHFFQPQDYQRRAP